MANDFIACRERFGLGADSVYGHILSGAENMIKNKIDPACDAASTTSAGSRRRRNTASGQTKP